MLKRSVCAAVVAAVMACPAAGAKPLTSEIRQVLVKGTSESCFANQVKAPANRDFTLGQLQTYCDCYANGFADNMQEEDMEKNQNGLTPEANKMATAISQKCAVGLKK